MRHYIASLLLLAAGLGSAQGATSFRDDRLSLNGQWRFQLRRDNRLLTAGPVRFGPVSASSQAAMLEPVTSSETSAGRWLTSSPVPLAGTILAAEAGSNWSRQIWKPHPDQQGPTWWQLDLGPGANLRSVAGIRLNWVKPSGVTVSAELSPDGTHWTPWASVSSTPDGVDTWLRATPARARFIRLQFTPAQFPGTRLIEVFLRGQDGALVPWLALPRKAVY